MVLSPGRCRKKLYIYLQVYSASCRQDVHRSSGQTKSCASAALSLSCFTLLWPNTLLMPGVSTEDRDPLYVFAKHTIDIKFSIR